MTKELIPSLTFLANRRAAKTTHGVTTFIFKFTSNKKAAQLTLELGIILRGQGPLNPNIKGHKT